MKETYAIPKAGDRVLVNPRPLFAEVEYVVGARVVTGKVAYKVRLAGVYKYPQVSGIGDTVDVEVFADVDGKDRVSWVINEGYGNAE